MSVQQNINFEHRINGALTDYDSLTLSSEDDPAAPGAYGLRRSDTLQVIVPAGTAFTHTGLGEYTYAVPGLSTGVTYDFWVRRVYQGRTVKQQYYFIAPLAGYCSRNDIEQKFGVDNVATYADLNNNQNATEISERIDTAIAISSRRIDFMLQGGPYNVPLSFADGNTDLIVVDWAATLAGLWLYNSTGQADDSVGPQTSTFASDLDNQYRQMNRATRQEILNVKSGAWRINAVRGIISPPIAVPIAGMGTGMGNGDLSICTLPWSWN
jgi:hypothetical protein